MRVLVLIAIGLLALVLVMAVCGCVSAVPGARAGWSISLVTIQLGGTQNNIDTMNTLSGTNVVQKHNLPIEATQTNPTTVSGIPIQ